MTSQFAAINAEGIALASDSAVTISSPEHAQRSTFNKVNKIFPVGGNHQIAIMICGSPQYQPGNVSWERVVGLFSSDLKKSPHDWFDDYVDRFLRFVKNNKEINDDNQNNLAIQRSMISWFSGYPVVQAYLAYKEGTELYEQVKVETDELEKSLRHSIEEFIDGSYGGIQHIIEEHTERGPEWPAHHHQVISEQMNNAEAVAEHYVDLLNLEIGSEYHNKLIEFINFHMAYTTFKSSKENYEHFGPPPDRSWMDKSGLVMVGFGEKDLLPKMKEFSAGPRISKRAGAVILQRDFELRQSEDLDDKGEMRVINTEGVTEHSAAAFIVPFAMQSEIQGVINGIHHDIDPNLRYNLPVDMAETLERGIIGDLSEQPGIGKSTMGKIEATFESTMRTNIQMYLFNRMGEALDLEGILPRRAKFRSVVRVLPLPELANFARKMVEIEADIRRLLKPVRSVGGKIKVVTITKENGYQVFDDENSQL